MSWITIIWPMVASACLTLAAVHLLVWRLQPGSRHHGLFALSAVGTAALAANELWMLHAQTAEELGQAIRWGHLSFWLVMISLVGFVRIYMRAGRRWLAWTVCGLRTLSLVLNFLFTPNLNFREITGFRTVPFLGESVKVPEGVRNPWMLVGQLSLLLLLIFVVDATHTVWRRGDRRSTVALGASIAFFFGASSLEFVLGLWGIVAFPLTPSLFFLGIVAVMSFELSRDVLRASVLARDLRESREQFRLAVEGSPNGIVLVDRDGRITLVNQETEKQFGYTRGELVGQQVEMLIPEGARGEHPGRRVGFLAAPSARAMGAGRELFARRKDGSEFPVEIGLSPIESASGTLVLAAIVDITARKVAEVEAVRQRAELAHFGRVSTMGQLASTLAHELNQPLGAILRNAEAAELFLRRNPPDLEEVGAIIADIRHDDRRAGEVIERMRALLERRQLDRALLSLDELVGDVMVLVQPDARSRRVALHVDVPEALPQARVDRVQLQQVLLNLIINGMDAMAEVPPGERRLVVRARQADERTIEVAVEDAGRGVPPEKLERLFEPFFTTKPSGMGLGLPISFTIIEAHGGRIWAESRPTGATFFFTLPVGDRG